MPQASMPTITSHAALQAADCVQGCEASPSVEGDTGDTGTALSWDLPYQQP